MALPNLPSLLDVIEDPSLILKLPAHIAQDYVTRMRAALQHGRAVTDVPPDPASMAILNPRYGWMDAPHIHYLSDGIATTVDANSAAMVTMPPRHCKTHLCSVWTPFWFLARRPDANVLLISYELTFARKWGVKVRSLVELYGKDYGLFVDPKKTAGDDWELTTGGGMKTVGVGGGISGNPVKLLIGDDLLKNQEEASSEVIREKVWDWWESTVIQRIEPDTSTILIGTRYHEDDLLGRVLAASKAGIGPKFDEITLRAKAEDDDPLGRPVNEGLWTTHAGWGQEFYDKREREVSPYVWSSVYQQRPSPPGGNKVDPAWWKFYQPNQAPVRFDEEIQTWDLALDSQKKADSFQCGGVLARWGASIFVRDCFHEHSPVAAGVNLATRAPEKSVVSCIRNWSRTYPAARQKLVERSLAGPMLVGTLHHEVGGMLSWPPKGRQKSSKEAMVEACVPDIRAGNVYLPLNPDGSKPRWVAELIEEFRQFPNAAHDDYVDMLTQGITFLQPSLRRSIESDQFAAKQSFDGASPDQQHTHALHALISKLGKPKLDEMKRQQRLVDRGVLPFIGTGLLPTARSGGRRRRTGMW
jgi:predicted phage terminase large subunit-like protein